MAFKSRKERSFLMKIDLKSVLLLFMEYGKLFHISQKRILDFVIKNWLGHIRFCSKMSNPQTLFISLIKIHFQYSSQMSIIYKSKHRRVSSVKLYCSNLSVNVHKVSSPPNFFLIGFEIFLLKFSQKKNIFVEDNVNFLRFCAI